MVPVEKEKFGHSDRSDRKISGATYTPVRVADAVASNLLSNLFDGRENFGSESVGLRLLDPGCGDGTLAAAALARLSPKAQAMSSVLCIDTDATALLLAQARLEEEFPETSFSFIQSDFIDYALAARADGDAFDIIIANPPYVRIQALSSTQRQKIKQHYRLSGRTDLAFPFILAMTQLLAPGGCAAVITSNRILSTDAGKPVRQALLQTTRITEIWDLGDTKLFEAAVLPAVLFFTRPVDGNLGATDAAFTSIYEATKPGHTDGEPCDDLCADLRSEGTKRTAGGRVFIQRRGSLETDGTWRLSSNETCDWAARIAEKTWRRFGDVGKVSVGIKTTADKVFISQSWAEPRPELLRPLVTHHVAGRFRPSAAPVREVLYTHEMRGGKRAAVDLAAHPVSLEYLVSHRKQLEGRSYVIEAGREWFEIWVPHSPEDWDMRKIVFRDIAEDPTFWIEEAGSVVNGDCYWIRLSEDVDADLIWLILAVGNSSLIERFYDATFNERLYAGRRRFMTRHVRQFPIPDPEAPASRKAAAMARQIVEKDPAPEEREMLERQIDRQVEIAFGSN